MSKALGTLCVYRLLRESGTIVVATVTTLRKVLSVLLSVAYFGHAVGAAQWAALALVFLHAYVGGAIAAVLRVGSGERLPRRWLGRSVGAHRWLSPKSSRR